MEASNENNLVQCNVCRRATNHGVISSFKNRRYDGDGQHPRLIHEEFELLKCLGCNTVTIRVVTQSPDFKFPQIDFHPPRLIWPLPLWHEKLPEKIKGLIMEVYDALNRSNRRLVAMGAGSIVDLVLDKELGDVGGFEKKLSIAVKSGLMTEMDRGILRPAIEARHAATHRGHEPTEAEIDDVMKIVLHLLEKQFVLPGVSERLNDSVPGRGSRRDSHGS